MDRSLPGALVTTHRAGELIPCHGVAHDPKWGAAYRHRDTERRDRALPWALAIPPESMRHDDPGEFGLPYAEAGVGAFGDATATCPACGFVAASSKGPKAAAGRYAVHYAAMRTNEATAWGVQA